MDAELLPLPSFSTDDLYSSIVEDAPDGIMIADARGRCHYVNPSACRMLGYRRDELRQMTVRDVIDAEDHPRLERVHARLLASSEHIDVAEWMLRRRDGSLLPVEVSSRILADGRWQAIIRDVSERKAFERKLAESAGRLAFLERVSGELQSDACEAQAMQRVAELSVPLLGDCCFFDVLDGRRLARVAWKHGDARLADSFAAIERFVPEEASDHPVWRALRTASVTLVEDIDDEWRRQVAVSAEHLAFMHAHPFHSALTVPLLARGHNLGALTFTLVERERRFQPDDVELIQEVARRVALALDNARLYRASLRSRAEAEASSARLQALFMDAPVALAIVEGSELRFRLTNERFCRLTGRRDVLRLRVREAYPESGAAPVIDAIERVYKSGEPFSASDLRVTVERDGAAEEAWCDAVVQPLRDAEGRTTGVIVVLIDVSEQVQARLKVEGLRSQAEAANRAKDEFLAMLGHELRNPLAPIATAVQLMQLRGEPRASRELRIIERQVGHLTRLVDDLLDVSRITRGKIELKRSPVELAQVIVKAVEIASPLLEARRHRVHLEVPARGLRVCGDEARLAQVFANLLTNAARYTEPGGNVSVLARRDDGRIVTTVRDDGIGVAPEILPRIFDLFVQGGRAIDRAEGGLGLGLALVRSLSELHGGSVTARSGGIGQGSEFEVVLPAMVDEPGASAPVERPRPAPSPEAQRILVVDDNEDAAELLSETLRAVGHEVAVAHDGAAALALVRGFEPQIAILDIGLPVMDGYELARQLRGQPKLAEVRLIAVTGYGQEHDRARSRAAHFEQHLVKPVDIEELLRVIAEGSAPARSGEG